MKKSTRSILEELLDSKPVNKKTTLETHGQNLIESVINLLETFYDECEYDKANELERKFISSIKQRNSKKFTVGMNKIYPNT